MVKFTRINIENEGIHKFFSPNEVKLIELLWEKGSMTSTEMNKCFNDLSLACIAGTLDRLVKSGIANRELVTDDSRAKYIYSPTYTEEEMGVHISEMVIERLYETFGDSVTETLGKYKKE